MNRRADIHLGDGAVAPTGGVPAVPPAGRDWRRLLQAAAMVASPVLMTAFQLVNPGILPREEAGAYLASIATDSGRFVVAIVCYLLAMLLAIPGAVAVLQLTRDRARLLGTLGAVFTTIGSCAGIGLAGAQLGALGLIADGAVLPYGPEAFARFQDGPGFHLLADPILGAAVGFLCTAIAFGLSRKVPLWVPFALFGGLVLGSDEFGTVVTVAGTAIQVGATVMIARALIRCT